MRRSGTVASEGAGPVLEFLGERGCPGCAVLARHERRFVFWFYVGESAGEVRAFLRAGLGLCPAHTRAVLDDPSASLALPLLIAPALDAARDRLTSPDPGPPRRAPTAALGGGPQAGVVGALRAARGRGERVAVGRSAAGRTGVPRGAARPVPMTTEAYRIEWVRALEILDSRGRPTLQITLGLAGGVTGWAGVPAGASTGRREAVELRDGDAGRYGGSGVQRAAMKAEGEVADALCGREWGSLADLDGALVDLDGTPDKGRLGANTIVGVSVAAARAMAAADGAPLHRWLAPTGLAPRLPVPHFNVLNGGAHAQNRLEFQEFMLAPLGAPNFREALRAGAETYAALRGRLRHAGLSTGLGDEGGFAPELSRPEDALDLVVGAVEDAGYELGGQGVAVALDPAASGFRATDGTYRVAGETLSSDQLVERYAAIVERYPVWSIEDGMAEDDEAGWAVLTAALGDRVQVVGDDLLVTNPELIAAAAERKLATAALIKLNQVLTVTETLAAMAVCRRAGWAQMVSHRSGETPDPFIADLAVATGCGQIKAGAPARGERVAKYNRLVEIEQELARAPYGLAP